MDYHRTTQVRRMMKPVNDQPPRQPTDWNAVGQGCQQLGCAFMLIPVVVILIAIAWGVGCQ